MLLDMQEQVLFADYFLMCNGESNRQIRALINGIREDAKQQGGEVVQNVEGHDEDGWMCIDFGHVVVHVFDPSSREYYNLEELWQDARVVMRIA